MSRLLEEMRAEVRMDEKRQIALKLLTLEEMSLEKIASLTGLTLEQVRDLDGKRRV